MNPELAFRVAKELQLSRKSLDAVLYLLEEDATIPFIARYR